MHHIGTQRIETERLVLRPFVLEDAAPMYRNWASDPEVTKYLTWQTHQNPSVTHMVIDSWLKRYNELNYYHWTVELRSLGEPIGSISGVRIDESTGTVEIGYCIGRPWWGQGLVAEAVRTLMAFFFEQVGVEQVVACHHPDNPNSGRVMQKCGMVFTCMKHNEEKGVNLCWYAISRKAYFLKR